ncbi:hypothetical protein P167DRAFT_539983 [Morchella conica CCBAS932]|uniref:Uncharacterized protein n=1 Tax=Morchella conica CCBAS932 TaxID=1392247 RepID=A0A3N4KAW0_9PEZI|nr:hypothetical protein P167DRAFT_539983 [Morchella conica CCBAS932]
MAQLTQKDEEYTASARVALEIISLDWFDIGNHYGEGRLRTRYHNWILKGLFSKVPHVGLPP